MLLSSACLSELSLGSLFHPSEPLLPSGTDDCSTAGYEVGPSKPEINAKALDYILLFVG